MRVTTNMLNQSLIGQIRHAQERLLERQDEVATGARIRTPADDPAGTARSLQARSVKRAVEQWSRNLDRARGFAQATEATLAGLSEIATEARVLASQAASESYGADELAAFAAQIDGLLEEALSEGNRSEGGVHLFAGTDTSRAPLTATRDGAGRIIGVERSSATAGEGDLQRLVDEQVLLTINTAGTDVFGEELEFFADLIALRDATATADHAGVSELLSRIDADLERMTIAQAASGTLLNRIAGLEQALDARLLAAETTRSELEDADVTAALVAYQQEQTLLQAALSAAVQTMDMSLINLMQK
ncbi:MAG: flagellar hook-associated protein FlgL [Candidatus Eisenbacteria bacterium]